MYIIYIKLCLSTEDFRQLLQLYNNRGKIVMRRENQKHRVAGKS